MLVVKCTTEGLVCLEHNVTAWPNGYSTGFQNRKCWVRIPGSTQNITELDGKYSIFRIRTSVFETRSNCNWKLLLLLKGNMSTNKKLLDRLGDLKDKKQRKDKKD